MAILGVLAAVAVPIITGYLGNAKKRAYANDKTQIQAAVDAYYASPNKPRFIGKRQYPIKGIEATSSTTFFVATSSGTVATPIGRTMVTASGARGEEVLQAEGSTSWHVVKVTRQVKDYRADTRNYIIDMDNLTKSGTGQEQLLGGAPDSASRDNCSGCTGSYTYYVDANGDVQSLYVEYPTSANKGFQDGVYP